MWTGKARPEHRIGQACHKRWAAYGTPQGKARRRSSRRCFIMSIFGCYGIVSLAETDAAPGARDDMKTMTRSRV